MRSTDERDLTHLRHYSLDQDCVIVLFLSGAIAYLTLLERKLIAHIQVRLGPMRVGWHGLLQPIADGLKFLLKEDIVPAKADAFIFTIAPAISLLPAFLVFAVVPFGPPEMLQDLLRWTLSWFFDDTAMIERIAQNAIASGGYVTDINIAVLFVLSVSSVGILGIILGGWASNSKYPLLGALRSSRSGWSAMKWPWDSPSLESCWWRVL